MRPKGAVHLALLDAAQALATLDRGATMRELAQHACVGIPVARYMVAAMAKYGALEIVRTRCVPYRNRPVAEYALPRLVAQSPAPGAWALGAAMSSWRGQETDARAIDAA
jgi:hypothetical protein